MSYCTTLPALTSHRNGLTFLFPSLLCLPVVGLILAESHKVALVGEPELNRWLSLGLAMQ